MKQKTRHEACQFIASIHVPTEFRIELRSVSEYNKDLK